MLTRYRLIAPLALFVVVAVSAHRGSAQEPSVTFHFYGAKDCPPCMAFKRDGLPVVRTAAAKLRFEIAVNVIEHTRDVATPGSYGPADAILRRAGARLKMMYPPIFFVTRSDRIVEVHDADWRAALARAEREAAIDVAPAAEKSES